MRNIGRLLKFLVKYHAQILGKNCENGCKHFNTLLVFSMRVQNYGNTKT